jgi:hypothetical protein
MNNTFAGPAFAFTVSYPAGWSEPTCSSVNYAATLFRVAAQVTSQLYCTQPGYLPTRWDHVTIAEWEDGH